MVDHREAHHRGGPGRDPRCREGVGQDGQGRREPFPLRIGNQKGAQGGADGTADEKSFRSLEAGAIGYDLKDIHPEDLVKAIEGMCNGRTPMHPHSARQLVERFQVLAREKNGGKGGLHLGGLTTRELDIVLEMTKGATDREIAHKIYVSMATVKSHIRSIFRKIGARNRTQAVVYVLKNGLVN